MKIFLHIYLISASFVSFSQSTQDEIDRQIWIPFTKAWESNDAEAYNKIHSDDVWRINPGRLLVGEEYKSRNRAQMKGQDRNSIIEFSFETRTNNGSSAYEVGYYRITNNSNDQPVYYVGRFHVALKKVDGKWLITQDWDTGEINGEKITPESLKKREFTHFL